MPYIRGTRGGLEDRNILSKDAELVASTIKLLSDHSFEEGIGRLNYFITILIQEFLSPGKDKQMASYWKQALIMGVLEDIKLEFKRRYNTPYEEAKCFENGDVYTISLEDYKTEGTT